ncbi:MAG: ATP-dependent helicase, partial [Acidimicrobiales bacterium]
MAGPTPTAAVAPGLSAVLDGLSEAQRRAVMSDEAPLCVLAAAGSGKTTVLTRRVARRVMDGSARAEHVLVVTFTRKAAGELRDRLGRIGVPGPVRAGTFHAVALAQLRAHWADTGTRPPALTDDPTRLVRAALGTGASPADTAAVVGEVHWAQVRMLTPDAYAVAASEARRMTPSGMTQHDVAGAFTRYVEEKTRRGVIDLDDLITMAAALLERDPSAAAAQRWRTRHLFVDEFQDVNPAQWRLLGAWLGERGDLFVVGDPRQAIYSWNGADPTLLDRLPTLLPGTAVVRLDDNHRSTPQVVSAATAVLGAEDCQASRPDGPSPVVEGFDDDDAEAAAVARWLRRAHRPGRRWAQLAVLARTNARLEPVARALAAAGIPYRIASDAAASAHLRTSLRRLQRMPARRSLRSALAELVVDPDAAAGGAGLPPVLARLADEHAAECPDGPLGEFLAWLAAGGDPEPEAEVDGVELSTFHRAKGLEWPAVAVVGLEDGMVPIAYAVTPDAVAEERRLLYVGLTRAEDELWCSWAALRRAGDRTWRAQPSPLLGALEEAVTAVAPEPDAR